VQRSLRLPRSGDGEHSASTADIGDRHPRVDTLAPDIETLARRGMRCTPEGMTGVDQQHEFVLADIGGNLEPWWNHAEPVHAPGLGVISPRIETEIGRHLLHAW